MPASTSTSRSDLKAHRTTAALPHRRLATDEAAVSEVVGYVLTFGVLAVILTVSLIGFNDAQEETEEKVVALRAASVAQRVAGAAVEAALLAEGQGTQSFRYERELSLPHDLEGHDYNVTLGDSAVTIFVQGYEWRHDEPLFEVGATLPPCVHDPPAVETTVSGGPLRVVADWTAPSNGCIRLEEVA